FRGRWRQASERYSSREAVARCRLMGSKHGLARTLRRSPARWGEGERLAPWLPRWPRLHRRSVVAEVVTAIRDPHGPLLAPSLAPAVLDPPRPAAAAVVPADQQDGVAGAVVVEVFAVDTPPVLVEGAGAREDGDVQRAVRRQRLLELTHRGLF